jgi:hypothetical protein
MTSVSRTFTLSVVAAPDPTVPAWVTAAPLYQWTAVPTSNAISSVQVSGTSANIVAAWGAVAASPDGDVYLFGGGHGDYSGNEVYRLRLNQAAPIWQRLNSPATPISGAQYYADGSPCSRHTYASLWFAGGKLKSLGGNYNWPNAGGCSYMDVFDPTTLTWQTQVSNRGGNWAACGDHTTGVTYAAQNVSGSTQYISLSATNVLSTLGTSSVVGDFIGAAYDSGRQRIYRFGSYDANVRVDYWQINGGAVDPALTGAAAATFDTIGSYAGVDYDSVNGWILYKDPSASTVYRLNCATLACDTLPTTGSAQAPTNGVNGRFKYVPDLKGFIYIPSWGVAYFLRTG